MIVAKESLNGKIIDKQLIQGKINKTTEYINPTTQEKTITPTKQVQEVLPDENVDLLSKVTVNAIPNEYIIPQGEIEITENGIADVTQYASANINVSGAKVYPPDWSEIGYEDTPASIIEAFNYAKEIQENWINKASLSSEFYQDLKLVFMPLVNTSVATSMNNMFNGCTKLTTVSLLNTSNVTNMTNMFYYCSSLTTIPQFDTSNVTNMTSMFYECTNLKTIPQLNTSKVTRMNGMFYNCYSMTTIPQLDTSNVTNMDTIFMNCSSLTSVPQLNTSKVTNISRMFFNCTNLTTVPMFSTNLISNINNAFKNCSSLSDESLNNILGMCIGATSYAGTKTLATLGLTSEQATICQGLSNYPAFINAGWTIGY